MALEIQVLIWNKHKNVLELNELLGYQLLSDQERGNDYGLLQHSMGHFSVVFVKTNRFKFNDSRREV
jgi:hypothetical protein